MRRSFLLTLMLVLLMCSAAFADNLEGIYKCSGTNPGGAGKYEGKVTIVKTGDAYQITWNIGPQVYMGVGIVEGETLSVGYTDTAKSWFGAVVYKIDESKLAGKWVAHGQSKLGSETLDKIK